MYFQRTDTGTDLLDRKIECTNFVIEFDKCNYINLIETNHDDLTFVQLNICGITNKRPNYF